MKIRWPFGKGASGAVANVTTSLSSADLSLAGSGGMSMHKKAGLPIDWETVLGSSGSAGKAELRKPYAQSVWVSRAIKSIAQPIVAVPLIFSQDARGGDKAFEDAALTAFWERPAKTRGGLMTREDFLEETVLWLKLEGEAFWLMDDTWLPGSRAKKSPLIVARPCDMRPILEHGSRELMGWTWMAANGRREVFVPEQVVHLKYRNPYDEIRGLAEWEAASIATESDYQAGVFARNLMSNNGDRGPYVIAKSGTPSDPQIKQITSMLRQKRELSRRGDFRPVFLTADVEVQEPGLQAVDAAFVTQRLENRHEIYAAFGVPMSFAEVMASYSIGSASDRFRLIEDTCMPTGAKICGGVEIVSALFTGKALFAAFDWDEHSTMQEVRRERLESGVKLVDRGMPWKLASDYLRLRLPRFPGDDVGRIPFNLEEIGGKEEKDPEPAPVEDPIEDLTKLFRSMPAASPGCGCGCGAKSGTGAVNKAWERLHKKRKPWVRKIEGKVSRLLMDARAETLRKLAEVTAAEEKTVKSFDVLSILFDLGAWLPKWVKTIGDVDRAALLQAGAELWTEELEKDDPLVLPSEKVKLAIGIRENRLRDAGTKVWLSVREDLQKAVNSGATNADLAAAIKKSFAGINDTRANAIANTETTAVYEMGRDITFTEAGVEWTQWLHSGLSDNARPSHVAANNQVREMGEKFDIGGVPMAYPGDPEAPASEVVNCKCVRIAVPGPDPGDIEGNENTDIPY